MDDELISVIFLFSPSEVIVLGNYVCNNLVFFPVILVNELFIPCPLYSITGRRVENCFIFLLTLQEQALLYFSVHTYKKMSGF